MLLQEPRLIFFANLVFNSLLTLSSGATAQCHDGDFVCPKERQGEFPLPLADLNDCNFFHICYSLQKSHRDSCGPEAHFNGEMCVEGLCPTAIPGCQPQESVGTTPGTGYFECPGMIGDGNPAEYPDTNDCQYFFICYTLDIMLRLSCGDNRHFDGRSCVAGECPSKIPGAEPLVPKDTDCDVKKFECVTNGYSEQADPNDCNFYFVCNKMNIVLRNRCGPEQHFEGESCIPGVCPSTVSDTCEHPSATTEMTVPTTETTNPTCKTGKFSCPNKPKVGYVMYPDPNDCRYWYACYSHGAYRDDCGVGKHWAGGKCVAGNCPYAIPNCEPLKQDRDCKTGYRVCHKDWGRFHDSNDCRYYFVCMDTGIIRKDCGEGRHKNHKYGCVDGPCPFALPGCKPQEAGRPCQTGKFVCPAKPPTPNSFYAFPDPNNCRYWYACYSSGPYRQDCGVGMHWEGINDNVGKCVVGQCKSAIPNCKPLDQDRECVKGFRTCPANSMDKTYHDANDCRYYFRCSEDGIIREDCGEGRHKSGHGKCEDGPCPFALPGCNPQEPLRPARM